MKEYNKLLILMVFALITCILTVGSASAADTNNSTGLANSSCPEYGINNNHTSQSNYTGPQTNGTKWTYKNITVYGSAVTGSDGTIYVGGYNGKLYAFKPDGTLKWTYITSSYILGSPAVGKSGTIYVSNWKNSTLYAINPSGTLKWKYNLGNYNSGSSPVIGTDGTLYISSTDSTTGYLYALSPDGDVKWVYSTGPIYGSSAAIGPDGTIYISDYNATLYAINPNGVSKWSYTIIFGGAKKLNTCYNTPSIGPDGTIYIECYYDSASFLYAFSDMGTYGLKKWDYPVYGEVLYGAPAISSSGTLYIVSSSKLYAVNPNGTLQWSYSTGGVNNAATSAVIGADGTIYTGGSNGIYALNSNGSLKWKYAESNAYASPLIGADGMLYIGTTTGTFYAFKDFVSQFTASITSGNGPLIVKFTDRSTGGPVSWLWNFGDGTTSTEQNPTHTYSKAGTYTVTLTVTNGNGTDKTIKTGYITVKSPTASVNVKSGTYNTSKSVKLSMSGNGTIYYTLNGKTPTTSNARYKGPINMTSTHTLKFFAVDTAGNKSPVYTAKYIIDKIKPKISAVSPKNKATGISRSKTTAIRTSESVLKSTNWSKIYIKNLKTGKKVKASITISGNHIYIKTSKKTAYTWYRVYIPAYAVKDKAGNKLTKGYTWTFKTGKY